jgi:hypothetical protein
MGNSDQEISKAKMLSEASAALFVLRDALSELSLALQDWQFASSLAEQTSPPPEVQQLMQRISAIRKP